jgi:pilus assembly protein CpaC
MTRRGRFAAAALAVAVMIGGAGLAAAQDGAASRSLTIPKDKSAALRLAGPATEVVVSQPDIAEIVATTDQSFYIRGKALGSTNILIYGPGRQLIEVIDVKVGYDIAALRADLAAVFPGEPIEVRHLADGLLLTGEVSNGGVARRAEAIAKRYSPAGVASAMQVHGSQQVVLEVRIIEASRRSLKEFGFELQAANQSGITFSSGSGILSGQASAGKLSVTSKVGAGSLTATLSALEAKGVIRTLAQPNLVALSGEQASFLAGGEFPFPVPQGDNKIAIDFRPFGVNLNFLPTISDNGLIRLKVAPEVSQLDPTRSLRLNGYDVPSLSVRRASTTVEIGDGESLAIAGLFQQGYSNSVRHMPGAGSIPILGALFRSASWQKDETELVIIITPRVAVGPTATRTPLDGTREPTAIDLILRGLSEDKPFAPMTGAGG